MKTADFSLPRPLPTDRLLADLKRRLPECTFGRLSLWTGINTTTLHRVIDEPTSAVVFCRLLERLGPRTGVVGAYLRHLPTLEHSALAHDVLGVSRLHSVAQKREGVTVVVSQNEFARQFVVYALGHAINGENRNVSALSVHGHDMLVPFDNIVALQGISADARAKLMRNFVADAKRAVATPIMLINLGAELTKVLQHLPLNQSRHLLVADSNIWLDPVISQLKQAETLAVRSVTRAKIVVNEIRQQR